MSKIYNRIKDDLALNALRIIALFSFFITAIGIVSSLIGVLITGIILLIFSVSFIVKICYDDGKF